MPNTDFTFAHHGSICVLHAKTDEGRNWMEEYLPEDFNGTIESRYADNILEGIRAEGLTVGAP